jgi:hypothetical protein
MPKSTASWVDVWSAVRDRQRELGWSDAKLLGLCGISETVYRRGRAEGHPLTRADKIAGLEDGLQWERGSVQSILHGGKPSLETVSHPVTTVDPDEFAQRLKRIEERQQTILEQLKASNRLTEELMERMKGAETSDGADSQSPGSSFSPRIVRDDRTGQSDQEDLGVQPSPDRR